MHAIAHGGCTDTVRESALEAEKKEKRKKKKKLAHRGLEAASVLRLAFHSDALPTKLSPSFFTLSGAIEISILLLYYYYYYC